MNKCSNALYFHNNQMNSIVDLMYRHPDDWKQRGRPFSGLTEYGHILKTYLDHPAYELSPWHRKMPQPITAMSSNHFPEHLANINKTFSTYRKFPLTKILVYDIGLEDYQRRHFLKDKRYILRTFDFDHYPDFVRSLQNMAWKIFIMMQCLIEFDGCIWFDTSISIVKYSAYENVCPAPKFANFVIFSGGRK